MRKFLLAALVAIALPSAGAASVAPFDIHAGFLVGPTVPIVVVTMQCPHGERILGGHDRLIHARLSASTQIPNPPYAPAIRFTVTYDYSGPYGVAVVTLRCA